MSEKKYTYRVRQGRRWGPFREYGPGQTLKLTQDEADGFRDSLELVKDDSAPSEPPDVEAHLNTLTVAQLTHLPEWQEVGPPRPTLKSEIVEAILAVREAG